MSTNALRNTGELGNKQAATCQPPVGRGSGMAQVDATTVALVVILAIIVVYYVTGFLGRGAREKFASKKAHEVYRESQELFMHAGSGASFTAYKTAVPDADAVLYTDARKLWIDGRLSPESVQQVL
jgi:hypothetical protein